MESHCCVRERGTCIDDSLQERERERERVNRFLLLLFCFCFCFLLVCFLDGKTGK